MMSSCRGRTYMWCDAQARPSSAGDGSSKAAAQEAALAAVEEEWSGRLGEALALCQDQEAALEQLQRQSLKDRRSVLLRTSECALAWNPQRYCSKLPQMHLSVSWSVASHSVMHECQLHVVGSAGLPK